MMPTLESDLLGLETQLVGSLLASQLMGVLGSQLPAASKCHQLGGLKQGHPVQKKPKVDLIKSRRKKEGKLRLIATLSTTSPLPFCHKLKRQ
jgi:hypothetical protein